MQLTIDDAIAELEQELEMRRLGDGPELGMLLLRPLLLNGWTLHETAAFAGGGRRLFILEKGPFEVRREAAAIADVAIEMVKEAVAFRSAFLG